MATDDSAPMEQQIQRENAADEEEMEAEVEDDQKDDGSREKLEQQLKILRKIVAIRDGEVDVLKKQLVSTELKVDAFKDRYQLQKALIMEEIRQQALQLATVQLQLTKWNKLASKWAQVDHAEDVESPDDVEGAQQLAGKLRSLFCERTAITKELETTKETNHSLVKALAQHGNRLSTVTNELDQTWVWLSKLKLLHGQLQTDESIMRYELKEKRQLLDGLKQQLEESRLQWDRIRTHNVTNQKEWDNIRSEFDSRKTASTPSTSLPNEPVPDIVPPEPPEPIESTGVDEREERLQLMEKQCRHLYNKLKSTTQRNAALVGRLTSIHQHYGHSSRESQQKSPSPHKDEFVDDDPNPSSSEPTTETVDCLEQHNHLQRQRQGEELKATVGQLQKKEAGQTDVKEELLGAQLQQMHSNMAVRNEECHAMIHNIQYVVAEMDGLRAALSCRDCEIASTQLVVTNLKEDNESLRNESLQLSHKLIQLVKDKDHLWKRCDQLIHLLRIQATDHWISDGLIHQCQDCSTRFTLFTRRHHCRLCGRIFCNSCSSNWVNTPACSKPVRTCRECYSVHWKFSQPDQVQQLLHSCHDETVMDESAGSLEQPIVNIAQRNADVDSLPAEETVQPSSLLRMNSESTDLKNNQIKIIRTGPLHSYDILIDPQRKDILSNSFVSASTIFRIPLDVSQQNATLHWKFKTEPKGIGFRVVSCDDSDDAVAPQTVMETTFFNTQDGFIEGSAILGRPGLYIISFDNSFSQYLAKKITYSLCLKPSNI